MTEIDDATKLAEAREYHALLRVNPVLAARYAVEHGDHVHRNPDDNGGTPAPDPAAEAAARAAAAELDHRRRVVQLSEARQYRELQKTNPVIAARWAADKGEHIYAPDPDDNGGNAA